MDMDEFLVSSETIPEICRWLESRGLDGGLMAERVMASRYDRLDKFAVENNMAYRDPYPVTPKYLCHTGRVRHARVHSFLSRGRQIVFEAQRLHFLHYKMPSLHPDMSGNSSLLIPALIRTSWSLTGLAWARGAGLSGA